MYSEIQEEFEPQFRKTSLNFQDEYGKALKRVQHYPSDIAKNAIKQILNYVLAQYAQTVPTTLVGKILRYLSDFARFVLPKTEK